MATCSPATLQARRLLACGVLTRGWSLEMGKKRRLKLSATRTAWSGGGGSSSVPWVPPPPGPPPRLFARPAPEPGTAAVAAILLRSQHVRGEATRNAVGDKKDSQSKREGVIAGRKGGGWSAHVCTSRSHPPWCKACAGAWLTVLVQQQLAVLGSARDMEG